MVNPSEHHYIRLAYISWCSVYIYAHTEAFILKLAVFIFFDICRPTSRFEERHAPVKAEVITHFFCHFDIF